MRTVLQEEVLLLMFSSPPQINHKIPSDAPGNDRPVVELHDRQSQIDPRCDPRARDDSPVTREQNIVYHTCSWKSLLQFRR